MPRIEETLRHLKQQAFKESLDWEIIIVDYISSDGTLSLIKTFTQDNPDLKLKTIQIEAAGKTPAIEAGFWAAKSEVVCIVDDDNLVDKDYVQTAHETMKSRRDVGVIGAFGIAQISPNVQVPEWFDFFEGKYAVGSQGDCRGYADNSRFYFWGAGSVFRRSAWIRAKKIGFEPILNPSRGTSADTFLQGFSGGEDPEMCLAIIMAGYKLWYEPSLRYRHLISETRLTTKFLFNTTRGVSVTSPYLRLFLSYVIDQRTLRQRVRTTLWRNTYLHFAYTVALYIRLLAASLFAHEFRSIKLSILWISAISEFRGLLLLLKSGRKLKARFHVMKFNSREVS